MIHFQETRRKLILEYTPELSNPRWVIRQLKDTGRIRISHVFRFEREELVGYDRILERSKDDDDELEEFRFRLGKVVGPYFKIPGRKLGIPHDVLLAREEVPLARKLFAAERNISVFGRISALKGPEDGSPIVVGGEDEGSIPFELFEELLAKFPTTIELNRYAKARVEAVIGEVLQPMQSARESYEAYLSKRANLISPTPLRHPDVLQAEIEKYEYLRDTVKAWLDEGDAYSEADWQRLIMKIILLLFPKYIAVIESVVVPDDYSTPGKKRKREIDICLVDAAGNADVIEIKRPSENSILGRSLYRENHVPTRQLTGSIIQASKYIFHLSKWGLAGENALKVRYADQLPSKLTVRITNPKAIIVIGRDPVALTRRGQVLDHAVDLEVIKRQYADVMDILTYDDLLRRLDNILLSLERRVKDAK